MGSLAKEKSQTCRRWRGGAPSFSFLEFMSKEISEDVFQSSFKNNNNKVMASGKVILLPIFKERYRNVSANLLQSCKPGLTIFPLLVPGGRK